MSAFLVISRTCLRLLASLPVGSTEVRAVIDWMAARPEIHGITLAEVCTAGSAHDADPVSSPRAGTGGSEASLRLSVIARHCALHEDEANILGHLVACSRHALLQTFVRFLERDLGRSPEAAIGLCCGLEVSRVFALLAPHGRLIRDGFVLSDATAPFMLTDAYAPSGLLLSMTLRHGNDGADFPVLTRQLGQDQVGQES